MESPRPGQLRFTVVGAYVADCIVNVSRLPIWGETFEARSIRTAPGGKALNQATALARQGAHVWAVGTIGADGVGRDIRKALTDEKVATDFVVAREHNATPICVCFVGEDGETSFVWHIEEDMSVAPQDIRSAEFAFSHSDAVLTTFEVPVPSISEAITLAYESDSLVVVQPAPNLANPSDITKIPWQHVEVLVPNEAEARSILEGIGISSRIPSTELASALVAELHVPFVVVTLGSAGCVAKFEGSFSREFSARRVEPIDTTGASDAFTATLAARLASGQSRDSSIDAAIDAATSSITKSGGHESMPYGSDLA